MKEEKGCKKSNSRLDVTTFILEFLAFADRE